LGDRVCLSFGIECDADVVGRVVDETVSGTRFVVESGGRTGRRGERLELTTGLVGHHNILNCLAATTLAREQGISDDAIAAACTKVHADEFGHMLAGIADIAHEPLSADN